MPAVLQRPQIHRLQIDLDAAVVLGDVVGRGDGPAVHLHALKAAERRRAAERQPVDAGGVIRGALGGISRLHRGNSGRGRAAVVIPAAGAALRRRADHKRREVAGLEADAPLCVLTGQLLLQYLCIRIVINDRRFCPLLRFFPCKPHILVGNKDSILARETADSLPALFHRKAHIVGVLVVLREHTALERQGSIIGLQRGLIHRTGYLAHALCLHRMHIGRRIEVHILYLGSSVSQLPLENAAVYTGDGIPDIIGHIADLLLLERIGRNTNRSGNGRPLLLRKPVLHGSNLPLCTGIIGRPRFRGGSVAYHAVLCGALRRCDGHIGRQDLFQIQQLGAVKLRRHKAIVHGKGHALCRRIGINALVACRCTQIVQPVSSLAI